MNKPAGGKVLQIVIFISILVPNLFSVCLFTGEIERNYGNFSLSTMNGDISLLGQNCARDDFHHISLFLDHNGRTVDTFLQEMLIDLEN